MEKKLKNNTSVRKQTLREIFNDRFFYLLILPAVALTIIFQYAPLWGVKMAFQEYNIFNPSASVWVGLKNFKELLTMDSALSAVKNTLIISMLNLFVCFPLTIIFALLLNEIRNAKFKKVAQTVSYLPHFLSWISVIGIATALYAKYGPINDLLVRLTGNEERVLFMASQGFVVPNIIILNIWKGTGWGSVVFLAAITGVDESLFEAAALDGAGRFKQVWHIILPSILPTIIIMMLWRVGSLFSDNFELVYGLQNPFINFEVIQTLVYREGIQNGNYGVSTAFGIMQGVINFIMLFIVNNFTQKTTGTGLF